MYNGALVGQHVSRHFEEAALTHFQALENFPLLVQRREQVAEAANALGRAQDQKTAGLQGVVHQLQEFLLGLDIDVDQEVPAMATIAAKCPQVTSSRQMPPQSRERPGPLKKKQAGMDAGQDPRWTWGNEDPVTAVCPC